MGKKNNERRISFWIQRFQNRKRRTQTTTPLTFESYQTSTDSEQLPEMLAASLTHMIHPDRTSSNEVTDSEFNINQISQMGVESLAESRPQPAQLVNPAAPTPDTNAPATVPDVPEIASSALAIQPICTSVVTLESLDSLNDNNQRLKELEARIAELTVNISTNNDKLAEMDAKLANINDHLSNLYELLTLLVEHSGANKKKLESIIAKL